MLLALTKIKMNQTAEVQVAFQHPGLSGIKVMPLDSLSLGNKSIQIMDLLEDFNSETLIQAYSRREYRQ